MAIRRLAWCLVFELLCPAHSSRFADFEPAQLAPDVKGPARVAVVYSEYTAQHFWGGGPAGHKGYQQLYASVQHQITTAGIDCDLLQLEDVQILRKVVNYRALVIPYASHLDLKTAQLIEDTLLECVHKYNIGMVLAGDFLTHDKDNHPRPDPYGAMMKILGLKRVNGYGGAKYDIIVRAHKGHEIMKNWPEAGKIVHYPKGYFSAYESKDVSQMSTLAYFEVCEAGVTIKCPSFPAIIATENTARVVHVAIPNIMVDTSLLHSAVSWVVAGKAEEHPTTTAIAHTTAAADTHPTTTTVTIPVTMMTTPRTIMVTMTTTSNGKYCHEDDEHDEDCAHRREAEEQREKREQERRRLEHERRKREQERRRREHERRMREQERH